MQPAVVSLAQQSKELNFSLIKQMGAVGKALVHGKPHQQEINFEKLNGIIGSLSNVNDRLVEAEQNSANRFYQTPTGKWVSSAIKITALIIVLGCVGIAFYQYFFTSPSESQSSGLATTITAGASALGHIVSAQYKQYVDKEAKTLQVSPPSPVVEIKAIRNVVELIQNFFKSTDQHELEDLLVHYQEEYPLLPSRIKKILPDPKHWHTDLIANIANQALLKLKKIQDQQLAATPKADEDGSDEEGSAGGKHSPLRVIVDSHADSSKSS